MMSDVAALEQRPTAYEVIGVHPSAPAELMSACYWAMARDLQEKRATKPETNAALHRLTHAYESVSDPVRRAGYNLSIGNTEVPLTKRALPHRRFFLLRVFKKDDHTLDWSVDPHEVLGLHPCAPQASVSIAYRLMRDTYLRLTPGSRRRETLLNLLDESYAVLRDSQKRAQLAGVGLAEEQEPPAPARDDPPVSDLPEPSQPDLAEAEVALPITAPAPVEPPKPPTTPPRAPGGPVAEAPTPVEPPKPPNTPRRLAGVPVAARAGREDGGGARRAAVAIVAFAAAVAATVGRGVLWAVVAIAALTVAAVHSGWVATRRWLREWREERRQTEAVRSREASSQPATSDEIFLGRLASTVGRSKTESRRPSDETTRR